MAWSERRLFHVSEILRPARAVLRVQRDVINTTPATLKQRLLLAGKIRNEPFFGSEFNPCYMGGAENPRFYINNVFL